MYQLYPEASAQLTMYLLKCEIYSVFWKKMMADVTRIYFDIHRGSPRAQ